MTRRVFMTGAAGLAGSAYIATLAGAPFGLGPFRVLAASARTVSPPSRVPDFSIAAERDVDLVLLDFEFYGFALRQVNGAPTLVPTVASSANTGNLRSNVIVVRLPPQSIGEAAYPVNPSHNTYQSSAPLPVDPPPVVSDVSGPSRLCFTLGPGLDVPLPTMTVDDLLDWSKWTLLVPSTAQVSPPGANGHPTPYVPQPFETSIEFPYALFIAPVVSVSGDPDARAAPSPTGTYKRRVSNSYRTFFATRAKPLYNGTLADLWTATLGRTNSLLGAFEHQSTPPPQVAAVWAVDYYDYQHMPSPLPNATEADQVQYASVPIQ